MPSWLHASTPAAISLAPFNPPLGVYPEMARAEPTLLAIKEGVMSLSGDDFSVKDQNGQTVVKCKGKAMSMRERKSESICAASPIANNPSSHTHMTIDWFELSVHVREQLSK